MYLYVCVVRYVTIADVVRVLDSAVLRVEAVKGNCLDGYKFTINQFIEVP